MFRFLTLCFRFASIPHELMCSLLRILGSMPNSLVKDLESGNRRDVVCRNSRRLFLSVRIHSSYCQIIECFNDTMIFFGILHTAECNI